MKKNKYIIVSILLIIYLLVVFFEDDIITYINNFNQVEPSFDISEIPEYNGKSFVYINDNEPKFDSEYINTNTFEKYSELDSLGRSGVAFANISIELMPNEERGSIGMIKPSGWNQAKYDIVDGKYLYNRCHLIGYQLTAENANEKNLITCTRQTNTGIMLEYENKVAKYIKETNNHVLYRSTPVYKNNDLVASGIQLEGLSVEDNGEGIKFNIYIYNVQDGININYLNGESSLE